jgi:hypothetical protein
MASLAVLYLTWQKPVELDTEPLAGLQEDSPLGQEAALFVNDGMKFVSGPQVMA